ncbi:hypothetical protein HK405_011229 [Cladochytrium tenue]|nr:hypothetical protein HK405_011229 [Cladochytrium tenue]
MPHAATCCAARTAAAAAADLQPVAGFASEKARPVYAPHSTLVPEHMALDLRVDVVARTLRASVRYSVRCTATAVPPPAAASAAAAQLARRLALDAVALDIKAVEGADVTFEYDGKQLFLTWAREFGPGETRDVVVEYEVTAPVGGLYFSVPDENYPRRSLHCITDHETERARYWLPCVDYPAVRTTLEFRITADASLTAIANGAQLGVEINADGTKTTTYKLEHKCPSYLLCWAVVDFLEVIDESVEGMPIRYYAPKEFTEEQLKDHLTYDDYRYDLIEKAASYFDECEKYTRPIVCRTYDSSWDLFDSHTYPGGSWRIHMLRQLLGEENFWSGVSSYIGEYAGKVVETDDFRRSLEKSSGYNLTAFFDQWVYGTGYPKLKASYSYDSDLGISRVTLQQDQSGARFSISVEVDVLLPSGIWKSGVATFSADDDYRVASVYFVVGSEVPEAVEIDPRGKVLHKLEFSPSENILVGIATKGRDIGNRINAFEELIKASYVALAKAKTQAAIDILAESLKTEKEVKSLMVLTLEAGKIRDVGLRSGFIHLLSKPVAEIGYTARGRAYVGIGRQRNPEDVDILLRAIKDDNDVGLSGFVRAGIYRALAIVGSKEAHGVLVDRASRLGRDGDESDILAMVSISALAQSVGAPSFAGAAAGEELRRARAEAVELIAERGLRDGRNFVRRATIQALVQLEAAVERADEIRAATRATFTAQDQPSFERVLLQAQKRAEAKGGPAAGAAKTVEELEERVKKLEKLVATLEEKSAARDAAEKAAAAAAPTTAAAKETLKEEGV